MAARDDVKASMGVTNTTTASLSQESGSPMRQDFEDVVDAEQPRVKGSEMVMNLIVGGLGTGMLSLPWAMAGASVAVGIVVIVLVVAVNIWTIMILVHAAERYQVYDLGALLGKLPGKLGSGMQIFTNLMVWVVLFGSLVSYIISICDSAQPFISGSILEQRWALAGLASILVLGLCFLDQKYLSFSSGAAILVNMYLLGLVCFEYSKKALSDELPSGVCGLGFAKGSVTMVSTMMQSVIIQMCVLPMYKELENRSPKRFGRLLTAAFSVLALIFIILAMAGYYAFGPAVQSNLLSSLPRTTAMNVAQAGMILTMMAVYPIMMIAMIAPVKNLPLERFGGLAVGAARRKFLAVAALILFFVVASFFVALEVRSLGLVNVLDGALCVGVFTALAPGLVGLLLVDRRTFSWKLAMWLLLAGGIALSILGLVFTENDPELLAQACKLPRPADVKIGLVLTGLGLAAG